MGSNLRDQQGPLLRQVAEDCACLQVRRASRLITQSYDHALAPIGLRATQFTLLVAIVLMDKARVKQLADELAIDRTTLTRNLKLLEREGFITMVPGSDRRERLASITEIGANRLAEALPVWQATQATAIKQLAASQARFSEVPDWQTLKNALHALVDPTQGSNAKPGPA